MKKKYVMYAFLPVLGLGLLGANLALANGFGFGMMNLAPDEIATRQQTMFQNEATLIGISVDDMKAGWAQGKTLQQIATDHGITADQLKQKMVDARTAQMKANLQTLVAKGVITQAQADARLAFLQTSATNGKGGGRMMGRGLMHGGFGF